MCRSEAMLVLLALVVQACGHIQHIQTLRAPGPVGPAPKPRPSPFAGRTMLPRYAASPHQMRLQPARSLPPAYEPEPLDTLLGSTLQSNDGNLTFNEALSGASYVGLYISTRWAGSWIVPKLKLAYTEALKNKGLEIVYLSADSNAEDYEFSFKKMPWVAVPFGEDELAAALRKLYRYCIGLPQLIILDKSGNIVNSKGLQSIVKDPEGVNFPWSSLDETDDSSSHLLSVSAAFLVSFFVASAAAIFAVRRRSLAPCQEPLVAA
eukprot:gnl/TRDRNA2_/TRDRNA2_92445_c0_seq1.p1 gnl/TRDRNA2_/TRDRNA2_92445_c0~~gnl/TRDRNA2_/TRDRNA2_92445_c0_seq1.p1  ORF type:complete len:264 (+),score=27.66 gnl/TRDRNA2_/TRDRNA2_92445_c0_seq1:84-875(+)